MIFLDLISDSIYVYGGFNPFSTLEIDLVIRSIIIFYCFGYFSLRGEVDNPHDIVFNNIYPSIIAALFMTLLGFPAVFIGIVYFGLWYWRIKTLGKVPWPAFVRLFIYVSILMAFFLFIPHYLSLIFIAVLIGTSYIQSEFRFREKRQHEKHQSEE